MDSSLKFVSFVMSTGRLSEKKSHNTYKILTKENIKHAANVKNDISLRCQIQDVDLLPKS